MIEQTPPTPTEITIRGQEIYNRKIKGAGLEEGNRDKVVAIEVTSEEIFIGEDTEETLAKAREKYPNKVFFLARIGSEGLFTVRSLLLSDASSNR